MQRINNNNSVNQIVELIQKQLAGSKSVTKSRETNLRTHSPAARKKSAEELAVDIQNKVKLLERDDHFSKRAERIFLESIIAFEFGDHILNDSRFAEMITDIHSTLVETSEFKSGISRWIDSIR